MPITRSWQDCEKAAKALSFTEDSVEHVDYQFPGGTSMPQGCFQSGDNSRFHFNQGAGGNSRKDDKILCARGRMYSQSISYHFLF